MFSISCNSKNADRYPQAIPFTWDAFSQINTFISLTNFSSSFSTWLDVSSTEKTSLIPQSQRKGSQCTLNALPRSADTMMIVDLCVSCTEK